jgi:hypothetical protein
MSVRGIPAFDIIFRFINSFFGSPISSNGDRDRDRLSELGFEQEVHRGFTLWSVFCLSFSGVGLLSSLAATLVFSLGFLLSLCDLLIVDMRELEGSFGAG